MGVEPTSTAWEAVVLPINYIRIALDYSTNTNGLASGWGKFMLIALSRSTQHPPSASIDNMPDAWYNIWLLMGKGVHPRQGILPHSGGRFSLFAVLIKAAKLRF